MAERHRARVLDLLQRSGELLRGRRNHRQAENRDHRRRQSATHAVLLHAAVPWPILSQPQASAARRRRRTTVNAAVWIVNGLYRQHMEANAGWRTERGDHRAGSVIVRNRG